MWNALKRHWPEYLLEAGGLAFFMMNAAWITTVLEYPGSFVHQSIERNFLRRIPLGIAMGIVIAIIIYNPGGKRSGAHINPAVTWAFLRLGKIGKRDAFFYTVFQFLGAIAAAFTMKAVLGEPFAHEKVRYAMTLPAPGHGFGVAFAAEFVITFILMYVVLVFMSNKKLEKLTGVAVAFLIMVYLWFETPLSGMSLNPARTFGSVLAGGVWDGLWVYFIAPPLAALLAAELFVRMNGADGLACARLAHGRDAESFLRADQPLPEFPVQKEGAAPLEPIAP